MCVCVYIYIYIYILVYYYITIVVIIIIVIVIYLCEPNDRQIDRRVEEQRKRRKVGPVTNQPRRIPGTEPNRTAEYLKIPGTEPNRTVNFVRRNISLESMRRAGCALASSFLESIHATSRPSPLQLQPQDFSEFRWFLAKLTLRFTHGLSRSCGYSCSGYSPPVT